MCTRHYFRNQSTVPVAKSRRVQRLWPHLPTCQGWDVQLQNCSSYSESLPSGKFQTQFRTIYFIMLLYKVKILFGRRGQFSSLFKTFQYFLLPLAYFCPLHSQFTLFCLICIWLFLFLLIFSGVFNTVFIEFFVSPLSVLLAKTTEYLFDTSNNILVRFSTNLKLD